MIIGEVCLLTANAARLGRFYRQLLELPPVAPEEEACPHQTLLAQETMLTVLEDEAAGHATGQRVALAFTVPDVDAAHARLLAMHAEVLEPPTTRPWGARNLCLRDPDGNRVYLRCFPVATAPAEDAAPMPDELQPTQG